MQRSSRRPGTGYALPACLPACLLIVFLCSLLSVLGAGSARATATSIGPGVAGQVHALCYDPQDPNIVYLGGDVCGVYRSTDGGEHWVPFWEGLVDSVGGAVMYVDDLLVVDDPAVPSSRRGVYAASRGGLFRLPEGSSTWQRVSDHDHYAIVPGGSVFPVPIPFSALGYDPVGHVLYVGAGTARWYADPSRYDHFYPDLASFSPVGETPSEPYSLWRIRLVEGGDLVPVPVAGRTDIGSVRQIATTALGGTGYVAVAARDGFFLFDTGARSGRT